MPKKTVSSEIESSGYDLVQAISIVAKAAHDSAKAGQPVGVEAMAALTAAIGQFGTISAAASAAGGDYTENRLEFIKGANIALYDLASIFSS